MPTLSIDWERSPRIIIVDAPDTEISAQQIVDLCRDAEDETDNAEFLKLVNAAGKEDLGGGTSVGITIELQNAKIGFDDRTNKLENGTVTTSDSAGAVLEDSAATFVTNLVEIGDLVVNTTDGSRATVIEVTSETDVRTTGLSGGTDNQFASADAYEVWEIIPCEVTGGNVVAVDDLGAALDPLLPTFGVYAIVSKASTGTLQEQEDIQHASFDGGVHVDVTSSQTGGAYPSGNSANPVNNWADAKIVDTREGFRHYFVDESSTLDNTVDFTDAAFTGKSIIDTVLSVPVGTVVDKSEFTNLSLEGSLGETTIMQRCFLGETNPLLDVRGVVEDCSIGPSPLTLGGSSATTVRFVRCNGAGEDTSPATVNGGGDGPKFDVQDYTGALKIANKTGQAFWDIHVTGELIIDSTCIAGVIRATGAGNLTDNSGINCTVIDEMLKPAQVTELWKLQGLERGNPMTVTTTERSVADQSISLGLTGDGTTTTTVTRQSDQTLLFDAPLTEDLVDDSDTGATATFTRASTATYRHPSTGLITSAAIDVPRFELNGVLIEESRTNLCTQSEALNEAVWSKVNSTVSTDAIVAPDGATTMDKLIEDSDVASAHQIVSEDFTTVSGEDYVFSTFAVAGERDEFRMDISAAGFPNNSTVFFNLTSGGSVGTTAAGVTADIEDWGGGIFRCIAYQTSDGVAAGTMAVVLSEGSETITYNGDGTSGMYFWGAQVEIGNEATSYIPTTTAAVARSADFLSYNTTAVVEDDIGSLIAFITPIGSTVRNAVLVNIANQLTGPLYLLDNTTQEVTADDGSNNTTLGITLVDNTESKFAVRWSNTDNELQVIAGGVASTATTYDGAFVRGSALYIGSDSTGNHINGNIKSVKIYNIDRGTAQLQVDTG